MNGPREDGEAPSPQPPALEQLLERALPTLQRAAPGLMCALLRQRCRTSDLVQSALLDAIRSFPGYGGKGESEFVGWTLRIMERNTLDRRRRLLADKRDVARERDGSAIADAAALQGSPADAAGDREQLVRVARALRRLPDEQRRVLQLVALRGQGHAEVARTMNRSEGACRVLLARARAALLVAVARQGRDVGR